MTQPLEWCPVKLPIINRVVTKVPKVDTRRRARVLPLTRAISVVELAKCWKLRESVGTRRSHLSCWKERPAVKIRTVRTISRKGHCMPSGESA
jgi:hypothetical protein